MFRNEDRLNIFTILDDLHQLTYKQSRENKNSFLLQDTESIKCFNKNDYFRSSISYFRNSSMNEIHSNVGDVDYSEPISNKMFTSKNKFNVKDFTFLSTIGSGAYAKVIKAKHLKTNEIYAIKILDKMVMKNEKKLYQIFLENQFLNMCSHQNIVKIYGAFEDCYNVYLVLEYCNKGDLAEFVMNNYPLSMEEGQIIIAQIVNCLEYLWSKKIIHRDIKPENLLVGPHFEIKLIDFATATFCGKVFDEDNLIFTDEEAFLSPQYEPLITNNYSQSTLMRLSYLIPEEVVLNNSSDQSAYGKTQTYKKRKEIVKKQQFVGTVEYMSPEVINNESIGAYTDIWSLGCIIYYIYTGQSPFQDKTEYLTFQNILSLNFSDSSRKSAMPSVVWNLIENILKINPKERIGYNEGKEKYSFEELKNHKFFQNFDRTRYLCVQSGLIAKSKQVKNPSFQLSEKSLFEIPKDPKPLKVGVLKKWSSYVFYKTRKVILYSTPRIDYMYPQKNILKGLILLNGTCLAEQVNKSHFILRTLTRNFIILCKPKHDISPW